MRSVALPHFPHPCLAVVWRNWNRVPVDRLARVLQAPEAELKEAAGLLGLDGGACDGRWLRRNRPYGRIFRSSGAGRPRPSAKRSCLSPNIERTPLIFWTPFTAPPSQWIQWLAAVCVWSIPILQFMATR